MSYNCYEKIIASDSQFEIDKLRKMRIIEKVRRLPYYFILSFLSFQKASTAFYF